MALPGEPGTLGFPSEEIWGGSSGDSGELVVPRNYHLKITICGSALTVELSLTRWDITSPE